MLLALNNGIVLLTCLWLLFVSASSKDDAISGHPTHCNSTSMVFGRWVKGLVLDSNATKTSSCGLLTDYELVENGANHTLRAPDISKYCWKPHDCILHSFSVRHFCHLTMNHSILIIGDSTQYMFFQALIKQINPNIQPASQWEPTAFHRICNTTMKLKYLRNDHLMPDMNGRLSLNWKLWINDYDIILVNTGSHINEYKEFLRWTEYAAVEFSKKVNGTNKLFVYRTTAQPHPYCSPSDQADLRPIHNYNDVHFAELDEDSPYNEFKWYLIPSREKKIIKLFERNIAPQNFELFDIAPMTSLRKDGYVVFSLPFFLVTSLILSLYLLRSLLHNISHRAPGDCLHFYLPSVIDSWVQLFFNILARRYSK